MKALVLDGHSRAAIESVQSLGRYGVVVDVESRQPNSVAFRSRYVEQRLIRHSDIHAQDFTLWLRGVDHIRRYDLIIPSTEASLLEMMALAPSDPLRTKAVLSRNDSLDIALNKEETHLLASRLHVRVPPRRLHVDLSGPDEPCGYPAVLKPTRSKICVNGRLETLAPVIATDAVTRRTTLERWLPYTPVLEQQYIAGKGIGIELLFNRGEKVWHFAHERLHEYPLTGGASTYRRSIAAPAEMLAASELLLTELAWHGVAMVEFKLPRNGDFVLVEINPRLWGSLALAIDAGVNFPVGLLQLARDGSLAPQHHYRLGYYTRDLPRDLVWMTENVRADHRNALLLTRHRFRSFFEYLRPLIGKESWDHFDPRDLGVT